MKIVIYYSSLTGNTQKLAKYLAGQLHARGEDVSLYNAKDVDALVEADLIILAFWCRRSSMDDLSLGILEKCRGKKVIAIGTIGGKAEEAYGRRVENTVRNVVEENNICLGAYACQGMIDPKRTEKRRALPKDRPHYLDDEGYARHLANRGRPHEEDLTRAYDYIVKAIYG